MKDKQTVIKGLKELQGMLEGTLAETQKLYEESKNKALELGVVSSLLAFADSKDSINLGILGGSITARVLYKQIEVLNEQICAIEIVVGTLKQKDEVEVQKYLSFMFDNDHGFNKKKMAMIKLKADSMLKILNF